MTLLLDTEPAFSYTAALNMILADAAPQKRADFPQRPVAIHRRQKPMAVALAMVRRRLTGGLASESRNEKLPYGSTVPAISV